MRARPGTLLQSLSRLHGCADCSLCSKRHLEFGNLTDFPLTNTTHVDVAGGFLTISRA